MKLKNLVPLVIILTILAGLVALRKSRQEPVSILEEVKLTRFLPDGLSTGDLARLELYAGGAPDEKLVLTKDDSGDRWRVTSHFDAPVTSSKIDGYLESLMGLEGEFRAAVDSDEGLGDYDLSDDKGFHVFGYKAIGEAAAFHILVGKSPSYQTAFTRADGSNDVFLAGANLRREAGLYSDELTDPPKADTWLDKTVLELNKDDVKRIALTLPDKKVVLEHREKPAEPEEEAQQDGETDAATPPEPKPVEYEWVVAEGGTGKALNETGLNSVLRKLANLRASKIVDPAKKAEWRLDDPAYTCEITVGEEKITLEAGRPATDGPGYVRVASGTDDVVYEIDKYGFEQLFPKGRSLFDLPGFSLQSSDLTAIEITSPEGNVVLGRKNDDWAVLSPKADLPIVTSKLTSMAQALARWAAEDYADAGAETGLDAPVRKVTFDTASGESHTFEIGGPSTHIDGAYARLDGEALILVMKKTDVDKIFVAPKDLFERALFDVDEEAIAHIEIARDGEGFSLDRTDSGWTVTVGEETSEADAKAANDLAFAIALLEGEDLIFDNERVVGGVLGSVKFTLKDGTEHRFTVDNENDGSHPVTVPGVTTAFLVSKQDISEVLLLAEVFKKAAPEAPATEEEP